MRRRTVRHYRAIREHHRWGPLTHGRRRRRFSREATGLCPSAFRLV